MDVTRIGEPNKELNELLLDAENVKLRDRIILSPYTKFLLPSLVFAFVIPVTVYAIVVSEYLTESSFSTATCNIRPEYYVDCLPGRNASRDECNSVLCCWNDTLNFCYHTVPAQHGYTPIEGVYYQGATLIPRETYSPLGSANVEEIHLDITAVDYNHLKISISTGTHSSARKRRDDRSFGHRVERIEDGEQLFEDQLTQKLLHFLPEDRRRRTVPIELEMLTGLNAYVHYPEFSVTVARNNFTVNEGSSILSTARGPFLLTETYWEWTLYVNNGSLYGLNDLELNGTIKSIYNNENGTITPAFLAISTTGEGAAYYVDYKGPLEVQVLNVSNLVILRGMALPKKLAIHVFAGPTPLEAVQQLTAALSSGSTSSTSFPPSQNYGLHICPNGILNSVEETFTELNETIESLTSVIVPWDSHCIHEGLASVLNPVLSRDDLEYIAAASELLKEGGRSFIPHLSPMIRPEGDTVHVAFEEADLLLSNGSTVYVGVYQETSVVYPAWGNADITNTATSYLQDYFNETGSPASLWLRDAWPKNEVDSTSKTEIDFTIFDYIPRELKLAMSTRTVPYDLLNPTREFHYTTHNNYSEAFRSFIRSSIPTIEFLGPPGEAANTTWSGLRRAIRSGVGAGLIGHLPPPMYICGTGSFDTMIHDQLCIRWYQAAVTWPHIVALPDRLPGSSLLSTSASLTISRILRFRASLATYQHTVVASHFQRNSPVLAPASLYYPEDRSLTHTFDQFMWGEALLVGLVTLPGVFQVPMQLPGDLPWRHLMGGAEAIPIKNKVTVVTATMGQLITLVRPGHVVPVHKDVGTTTSETMLRNISLAVNLDCKDNCLATGNIFYGSNVGEYLSLEINVTHVVLRNVNNSQIIACDNNLSVSQSTFIETVELLGNISHAVNTELCDLEEDNFVINLT